LSRIEDDVQRQNAVKREHRTQVLLPAIKVDPRITAELGLQLAPIKSSRALPKPGLARELGPVNLKQPYNSIQLVDRILQENRASPDLAELRTKAQHETEGTWELRDGLLLRYGKLYVTEGLVTTGMPLRTAIIREAHDQPLSGHPGRAKLRQLL
jgi:hypothetical protein